MSARTAIRRLPTAVLLTAVAATSTGCGGFLVEKMCSEGEYPVVRGDGQGGNCVADGTEPTGADVRYPAAKVPDLAADVYSPTLGDYLEHGDERQQEIARAQLRRLARTDPAATRRQLLGGPIFPSGRVPDDQRP
jgi:hypothetical protein